MKRISARAIVVKDDSLLVMYRNKFGSKYVTLPGGRVEAGEQPQQTVLREVTEETSVHVESPRLVFIDQAEFYGDQYVYVCDYVSGQPQLGEHTHEFAINQGGKNLYEPGWLSVSQLESVPFLSTELQTAIVNGLQRGWPNNVVEFTSKRNVK